MASKAKPNLSELQLKVLISDLIDDSYIEGGKCRLAEGAANRQALKHGISRAQVYNIWKRAMESKQNRGY